MGSIPTWQEGGTSPDKKMGGTGKESCWQCFKLYALDVDTSEFKQGSKVSIFNLNFTTNFLKGILFSQML
jgi:hypothetical protein